MGRLIFSLALGWLSGMSVMAPEHSARAAQPQEKTPVLKAKLEQFQGRWITSRARKEDEKIHREHLILEFKGEELTFFTEEDGKKGNQFTLKVMEVEQRGAEQWLVLRSAGAHRYTIHYDLEGGRLILVGRLLNRPFENFSLSGEYRKAASAR